MTDNRNNEPGNRMRKILYDSEEDTSETQLSHPSSQPQASQLQEPSSTPTTQVVTVQPASRSAPPKRTWVFGPPFWTVTGCMSLVVNGVLIAVLLSVLPLLGSLQFNPLDIGSNILGGLYSNFEKMDRATIETTIPVKANVPLNISVPVQTTTQITLAEAAVIPNARVVITTGTVNINSNASVTLPAGTPLMVNLNFNLPVQDSIPIDLAVPVKIPMASTELHEPFVGLQEVVRPWYCIVEPNATSLIGQTICP